MDRKKITKELLSIATSILSGSKTDIPDVGELMDWEDGKLDDEQEIDLFQRLVNCGLAWQLQGMYGRRAKTLIDAGLIQKR